MKGPSGHILPGPSHGDSLGVLSGRITESAAFYRILQ